MNALSLRNAIAHGFNTQITQNSVYELIKFTEQLLKALNSDKEAS